MAAFVEGNGACQGCRQRFARFGGGFGVGHNRRVHGIVAFPGTGDLTSDFVFAVDKKNDRVLNAIFARAIVSVEQLGQRVFEQNLATDGRVAGPDGERGGDRGGDVVDLAQSLRTPGGWPRGPGTRDGTTTA